MEMIENSQKLDDYSFLKKEKSKASINVRYRFNQLLLSKKG